MTANPVSGRPQWAAGSLYTFLFDIFPTYRTKIGGLDVQKLRGAVGKSHEAIYQWLRKGKVSAKNARLLVDLAGQPANAEALRTAGREPPTLESFLPFM